MPRLVSRILKIGALVGIFFYELWASSVAVARAAFARQPKLHPAILAVPIDLKSDFAIAALANLVTLTPGTCSLHVSEDRHTLYVHALDAPSPDEVIASIQNSFEKRIAEIEK
jgi:multicomponent Na+:H+ antiporter subunit E